MVNNISVKQLKERIDAKTIILIDVRERFELEICKIKGSINIKMEDIPNTIDKMDKNQEYAIICHSGTRSFNISFFLVNRGFSAYNVKGGIDAWAKEIDHLMDTY
jgi:rhodanese-related sulfurtransferase|tara:strand:+ start:200 stop:514 length:315 start_codon:yes stop_codon:yes gene_type:complete